LLSLTTFKHHRHIFNQFNIDNRLTGLIGPRGTGKTTLLLQYIKEKMPNVDECIYASIDHIYFSQKTLLDFVERLYDEYGVRYFFLDEIHKYKNWNQELKNIYDSYPNVKVVFSGSSSIDLTKGTYDLSRRGVVYRIGGMSFREYLLFNDIADTGTISLCDIMGNRHAFEAKVASINKIKGHFKQYLGLGYYPFVLEVINTYGQKIGRIIDKTIFEDIANHYKLKTENLFFFKKILGYLSTIPPGELSRNSIAKHLELDNKTIQHYLNILQETGLIELVRMNKSGSAMLKKTEKIYLDNPDLYKSIAEATGFLPNTGTIREIFFLKMMRNAGETIQVSKIGDFVVKDCFFEIGGRNKDKKQIKQALENSFLIKADILYGSRHEIPLHLFGFLY
jgi:predicted AAA+ superfamily ATPase